jgi:hypothetical protein
MTERRGRRRKQLLDYLKETKRWLKLKEEALDRTLWQTLFGRGYGPVVRQTTEWMNEWINQSINQSINQIHGYPKPSQTTSPLNAINNFQQRRQNHRRRKAFGIYASTGIGRIPSSMKPHSRTQHLLICIFYMFNTKKNARQTCSMIYVLLMTLQQQGCNFNN